MLLKLNTSLLWTVSSVGVYNKVSEDTTEMKAMTTYIDIP